MLLESVIAMMYKPKKEHFAEEQNTTPVASTWYDVMFSIFGFIWLVLILILWLRIVFLAFSCSVGEGVASILFSSHYGLYKFGDLIKVSCASVKL
jgi:hypothetical protein